MSKPKIMTVYGTRPEAIKVAPVIKALEKDERFESVAVSTGQHKEMLEQVNTMFGIEPKLDLHLMKPGQGLNEIVSRALMGLDEIIDAEQPDVIISQGDTSTAMAAALAGFHRGVKIVHLEAGLRTGDIHSPFPEEANRKLIGQVAELHLAPTAGSMENLRRENVRSKDIAVTGNTVIDALLEAASWDTEFEDPALQEAAESGKRLVVVTTHRRENLEAMKEIGGAVKDLAEAYPDINFVLPLHLNPKVREAVLPEVESLSNVIITDPLPYDQFTKLLDRATIILTDSGGVQEEAPALGKPVLVMRQNTERPEAVVAGTVKLVGTNRSLIVAEAKLLLDDDAAYHSMANAVNPYGDGKGAERSVAAIAEMLGVGERLPDFAPEA
ncbi:UDP-N-acetylglucosamine 2-epimerase (non-hydrolyzing) [Corynebacterium aurimucosum]|uniref:non-hydrolyzing UDP-N-acetylglucosamine 2-epimerase n=1 Tax=Corynebacterium guaraldiae TaxID=3051103 RepID=UPI0012B8B864|nr:UDP-N-acetylglucosamine 2-epimerase (non-hydrolyzing) [Corynebacterium guaraldiae]MDK6806999.1 UDP-N-acetylglucosamine 2-epimerase (non-hydrolyzing) [Corynebacterium aurimucosum]MTE11122.1 UDP-N-acetylglucosamine 2-epimerase (non-hydrolyzing) [Corynebacterium guaraldiae]NJJ82838.1 UDP-N-acetylglucosamine 2-epimerase (non-hydrolyzing) [Corynebacterium aurimucosum]